MGEMKAYRYRKPDLAGYQRATVDVCNTDEMNAFVTCTFDGETEPHSHFAEDATWLVLAGSVAFYDEDAGTKVVLEKHDFACIPAGTRYWFEAVGDELLELCRFSARDMSLAGPVNPNRRRRNLIVRAEELQMAGSN